MMVPLKLEGVRTKVFMEVTTIKNSDCCTHGVPVAYLFATAGNPEDPSAVMVFRKLEGVRTKAPVVDISSSAVTAMVLTPGVERDALGTPAQRKQWTAQCCPVSHLNRRTVEGCPGYTCRRERET